MSGLVTWRALHPCFAGGAYRNAGDVFKAPDGDYAPDVREKVAGEAAPAGENATSSANSATGAPKGRRRSTAAPGMTLDELPSEGEV